MAKKDSDRNISVHSVCQKIPSNTVCGSVSPKEHFQHIREAAACPPIRGRHGPRAPGVLFSLLSCQNIYVEVITSFGARGC